MATPKAKAHGKTHETHEEPAPTVQATPAASNNGDSAVTVKAKALRLILQDDPDLKESAILELFAHRFPHLLTGGKKPPASSEINKAKSILKGEPTSTATKAHATVKTTPTVADLKAVQSALQDSEVSLEVIEQVAKLAETVGGFTVLSQAIKDLQELGSLNG